MNGDLRLGRQGFWIGSVLVWAVFFGGLMHLQFSQTLALVWAGAAVIALLALMRARMLDRGRSPWSIALILVPLLGAVWLFWELACRGTPDAGVPRT